MTAKKRWFDTVVAIPKAFSLCGILDEAIELREEIAFLQAIKSVIAKATETDKKRAQDRKNAVLKQVLDNAVVAEGVEDIFKLAGLERPDFGWYSNRQSGSRMNRLALNSRHAATAACCHAAMIEKAVPGANDCRDTHGSIGDREVQRFEPGTM